MADPLPLPGRDWLSEAIPVCPECHHAVQTDGEAEVFLCTNLSCGNVIDFSFVSILIHPIQVFCPSCEANPFSKCTRLGVKSGERELVHDARIRWFRDMLRTGGVEA